MSSSKADQGSKANHSSKADLSSKADHGSVAPRPIPHDNPKVKTAPTVQAAVVPMPTAVDAAAQPAPTPPATPAMQLLLEDASRDVQSRLLLLFLQALDVSGPKAASAYTEMASSCADRML